MGVGVRGEGLRAYSSDAQQIACVIQGTNEKKKSSSFIKAEELQKASKSNRISTEELDGRDYSHF